MTMEWHEINDSAGRDHEEIGSEDEPLEDAIGQDIFQATLEMCSKNYKPACEHLNRRINLSTAMVTRLDCGEDLMDLNPLLSDSLRVARNLP